MGGSSRYLFDLLTGENCFVIGFKLAFANGGKFTFEESSSERANFISEKNTVEMIILMLDYPCFIAIKHLIVMLPVFIIITYPYMLLAHDLFP
jgi:hypothetical protein